MTLIDRARAKLGDFWWWSLCLFVALRCGDAINAFVGLWLVPKYVPQSELGAVLPLLQVTGVFGLPISVLVITFTKFLNQYKTQGEDGKVKSLIRTFWGFAMGAILLGTGVALWLMPHFFERIRVQPGSLGILIIATAVLSTTAPVFTNALQALMKFRALTVMNLFCAPIRLLVMLVAMPIRALSGYMVGQAAPPLFQIVWSWFAIRKDIRPSVRAEPFWREDWRRLLRYATYIFLWNGIGTVVMAYQMMIVRQRMSDLDSAAYYMISRFSELSTYAGLSFSMLLFPMAAKAAVQQKEDFQLFVRTTSGSLVFGVAILAFLWAIGERLFMCVPLWNCYARYVPDMVLLGVIQLIGVMLNNFSYYEVACNRFSFLWFGVPVTMLQLAFFVCFSGARYFDGILPPGVISWMESLGVCNLRPYLYAWLAFMAVNVFCVMVLLWNRSRRHNP